jgi:hypothetical protein
MERIELRKSEKSSTIRKLFWWYASIEDVQASKKVHPMANSEHAVLQPLGAQMIATSHYRARDFRTSCPGCAVAHIANRSGTHGCGRKPGSSGYRLTLAFR